MYTAAYMCSSDMRLPLNTLVTMLSFLLFQRALSTLLLSKLISAAIVLHKSILMQVLLLLSAACKWRCFQMHNCVSVGTCSEASLIGFHSAAGCIGFV